MKIRRQIGGLVAIGVLVANLLFVGSAQAAGGSAVISVDIAPSPVTAGGTVSLSFYVTPSAAINVYSAAINVNLSNLSFVSYSPSSSPMTGSNSVASGGSAGSTSFTIVTSHSGASAGSSGKTLMGVVTATASGSAGTGQVSLSGADAYDVVGDPMSASDQDRSVTINAPASGGGGGGGGGGSTTPPPSGGTGGTGGTGGGSNTSSDPVNPITQPNPESTVAADNQTMTENEYSLTAAQNDAAENVAVTTKKPASSSMMLKVAAGLLLVGLVAVAAKIILSRVAASRGLSRHASGAVTSNHVTPHESSPEKSSKDDHNTPGGPTIITPKQ